MPSATRRSGAGKEYLLVQEAEQAEPAAAVPTEAGSNFGTNSWGQPFGIATVFGTQSTPLPPGGGLLAINGKTDLTGLTGGPQNGQIKSIYLDTGSIPYKWRIWIRAAGPPGVSSRLHLEFQDLWYDSYYIEIYSRLMYWHELQYNSIFPQLINFSWNYTS